MTIWRQGTRAAVSLALAALVAGGSLDVMGQDKDKDKDKVRTVVVGQDRIFIRSQGGGAGSGGGQGSGAGVGVGQGVGAGGGVGVGDNTFVFVSSEMIADGKIVKGAPYSAEAVTETTQVLGDGNRIVRKNTAQVYRDSEGRTRRDQTIGMIGPFAAAGDPPVTVFIHDPVGGTSYVLDPRSKTARKATVHLTFEREGKVKAELEAMAQAHGRAQADAPPPPPGAKGEGQQTRFKRSGPGSAGGGFVFTTPMPPPGELGPMPPPDVMVFSGDASEPKVEQLEKQTIEGVAAEGTRMTHTIPAGAIGNEQPINIVHERWYSPELQTTVMTRHSDPRFGETVYRLTNINRTEPARTLFEVPSDYTLRELPGRGMRMKRSAADRENFQFHFTPGEQQ